MILCFFAAALTSDLLEGTALIQYGFKLRTGCYRQLVKTHIFLTLVLSIITDLVRFQIDDSVPPACFVYCKALEMVLKR